LFARVEAVPVPVPVRVPFAVEPVPVLVLGFVPEFGLVLAPVPGTRASTAILQR